MGNAIVPHQAQGAAMAFQGQQVRHVLIDDEPWFVAADVCRILFPAYNPYVGVSKWTQYLAPDEKRVAKQTDKLTHEIFVGQKMTRSLTLLAESGLYKIILRAKPGKSVSVKAFQDWVTREVLPSIRKTGGYLLNEEARATAAVDPRMPGSFAEALRLYADEVDKREEAARLLGVDDAGEPADKTHSARRQLIGKTGTASLVVPSLVNKVETSLPDRV